MGLAIGNIVELICPKPAALFSEPSRDVIVVLRIAIRLFRHSDHFCAELTEQTYFFGRLSFGNDDSCLVASGSPDYGKADACVTRSTLDDRCARLEQTLLLGIGDDPVGRTIFYRATGIHKLRLAEDFTARHFG